MIMNFMERPAKPPRVTPLFPAYNEQSDLTPDFPNLEYSIDTCFTNLRLSADICE